VSAGARILATAASLLCGCTHAFYDGTLELVAVEVPSAVREGVGDPVMLELCPPDHAFLSELVEKALAQRPGTQALADVKIVVDWDCSTLEGIPIRSGGPAADPDPSGELELDLPEKEHP